MSNMEKKVIGIDIGGTNTVVGLVSNNGEIHHVKRFKTKKHSLLKDYINVLCRKISEIVELNPEDIAGVGVGAPDVNQFNNTIEFAHNLPWKDIIPLGELLENKIHLPVQLINDANAATLGEMKFGAAMGMKDFILLTIGTGLGSGIVANGKLILGHDGLAGELGHVIIKENGRQCGCGRKGCLETYVSATGLITTTLNLLKQKNRADSLLRRLDPKKINGKSILQAAKETDRIALEAIDYTAKLFGKALADFVVFSSPEAIILFGGIVNSGKIFLNPVRKYMNDFLLKEKKNRIKLLPSKLTDNHSAILGAASVIYFSQKKQLF